jgi:hypothetical protein
MKKNFKLPLAVIAIASTTGAWGQTAYIRPSYSYPPAPTPTTGGVQLGNTPIFATPYVGAAAGYDDNVFFRSSNEKTSGYFVLSPGVKLDARDANKVFQFGYQGQFGHFSSSSDDDYADHVARGQFDMAIDAHNFLRLGLEYIRGHDPRGSTDRPLSTSPDKYRQTNPSIMYALGAPGAIGRVELYYSDPTRKYLNNREFTAASDRSMQEYGGAFYYRAFPKTYLMAEARKTDIRYDIDSPLSAREYRYFGGVSWEATAATTGTMKFGALRRDFTASLEPNFSGTSWEGVVTWAPRTYSKFDFYTVRTTSESTGLGSFILSSMAGVGWTHAWSSYLSTGADLRLQRDAYQGADRTDRIYSLGLKAGYRFRRWLTLGAEFSHTKRDSNQDLFDYDRNIYLLTATASM